jgi:hypothetical protein
MNAVALKEELIHKTHGRADTGAGRACDRQSHHQEAQPEMF